MSSSTEPLALAAEAMKEAQQIVDDNVLAYTCSQFTVLRISRALLTTAALLDEARRERDEAVGLLEAVEWAGYKYEAGDCPMCRGRRGRLDDFDGLQQYALEKGHAPDCKLAAFLAARRGAPA